MATAKETAAKEGNIPKKKQDQQNVVSKTKTCFIICPLSSKNSETRIKSEGLNNSVIKPVLTGMGFNVDVPHEIDLPGSITSQIIKKLIDSDLVLANLTELNPNVMYELAVRHATRKPVITLAENGTVLPFDIHAERTIFFDDNMFEVEVLKPKVEKAVAEAMKEVNIPDNPIYRTMQDSIMQEVVVKESGQDYILDKFNELTSLIKSNKSTDNNYISIVLYLNGKHFNASDGEIHALFSKVLFKLRMIGVLSCFKLYPQTLRVDFRISKNTDIYPLFKFIIDENIDISRIEVS